MLPLLFSPSRCLHSGQPQANHNGGIDGGCAKELVSLSKLVIYFDKCLHLAPWCSFWTMRLLSHSGTLFYIRLTRVDMFLYIRVVHELETARKNSIPIITVVDTVSALYYNEALLQLVHIIISYYLSGQLRTTPAH